MNEDTRCCGTGTCLIDAQGRCWCGQLWDGEQMCRPALKNKGPDPAPTDLAEGASSAEAD